MFSLIISRYNSIFGCFYRRGLNLQNNKIQDICTLPTVGKSVTSVESNKIIRRYTESIQTGTDLHNDIKNIHFYLVAIN